MPDFSSGKFKSSGQVQWGCNTNVNVEPVPIPIGESQKKYGLALGQFPINETLNFNTGYYKRSFNINIVETIRIIKGVNKRFSISAPPSSWSGGGGVLTTPVLKANTARWNSGGAANVTTASFTPTANALLVTLVSVFDEPNTGIIPTYSISGGGLAWTQRVLSVNTVITGGLCHTEIWTAQVSGSPSSMTVTLANTNGGFVADDTGGGTGHLGQVAVLEVTGHNRTSPTGLTALKNTQQGGSFLPHSGTENVSLGGTTNASSITFGVFAIDGATAESIVDEGAGWTPIWKILGSDWFRMTEEYRAGAITTVDTAAWTETQFGAFSIAGLEIKAADSALVRTPVYGVENINGDGGTGNWTTGSFTPPPNSFLVVSVGGAMGAEGLEAGYSISSTGSLSFTQQSFIVPDVGDPDVWSSIQQVWTAPVGGSPSSMTITLTSNITNSYHVIDIHVVAYTGYNTTNPVGATGSVAYGYHGRTQSDSAALTLSSAPNPTSYVFASLFVGPGFAAGPVTVGTGWSEIYDWLNSDVNGLGYQSQDRTGSSSTSVVWDAIDTNLNSGDEWGCSGFALEIRAAGSTGTSGTSIIQNFAKAFQAASGGSTTQKALTILLPNTLLLTKSVNKIIQVPISNALRMIRSIGKIIQVPMTNVLTLVRQTQKIITSSHALVVNLAKSLAYNRIIQIPISNVLTLVRSTGKIIQVPMSNVLTMVRSIGKIIQVPITNVLTLRKSVGKILTMAQALVVNFAKGLAFNRNFQIFQGNILTLLRSTGKIIQIPLANVLTLIRSTSKLIQIPLANTLTLRRSVGKILTITQANVLTLLRSVGKIFQVPLSNTLTLLRSIGKIIQIPMTNVLSLIRQTNKIITWSLALVVNFGRTTGGGVNRAFTIVQGNVLTLVKSTGKIIPVPITNMFTNGIKSVGKRITVPLAETVNIIKSVAKTINVTSATATIVNATRAFLLTLTVSFNSTVRLTKSTGKIIQIPLAETVNIVKAISKRIVVPFSNALTVVKSVAKNISVTSTTSTVVSGIRAIGVIINVAATTTVSVAKSVGKIVAVASSTAVTKTLSVAKQIAVTSTSSVSVAASRLYNMVINATVASAVTLSRTVRKIVSVSATTAVAITHVTTFITNFFRRVTSSIVKGTAVISSYARMPTRVDTTIKQSANTNASRAVYDTSANNGTSVNTSNTVPSTRIIRDD